MKTVVDTTLVTKTGIVFKLDHELLNEKDFTTIEEYGQWSLYIFLEDAADISNFRVISKTKNRIIYSDHDVKLTIIKRDNAEPYGVLY